MCTSALHYQAISFKNYPLPDCRWGTQDLVAVGHPLCALTYYTTQILFVAWLSHFMLTEITN